MAKNITLADALADAERKLQDAEDRVTRLRAVVAYLRGEHDADETERRPRVKAERREKAPRTKTRSTKKGTWPERIDAVLRSADKPLGVGDIATALAPAGASNRILAKTSGVVRSTIHRVAGQYGWRRTKRGGVVRYQAQQEAKS